MKNRKNKCQIKTRGVSKYKGVSRHRNKWQAKSRANRKYRYIGVFENEIDAAQAYDIFAKKHFNEFKKLNFPS